MNNGYILACESTVDLPYSYITSRDIAVNFYSYTIDGVSYEDNMSRDPNGLTDFYAKLAEGKLPTTSQINEFQYMDFLTDLMEKGQDVLFIVFGSGMTPSIKNAQKVAEELRMKYPEQKLIVIDSYCSCSGYGLLVDYAADLRDQGKTIDEVADWVYAHVRRVHHQFFSTDMAFFRRSGRVSGATAMIASVLGICPIMHLNYDGRIVAYSKVRGRKNAIRRTVQEMLTHAENGAEYSGKCFISHSNCLETAMEAKTEIETAFPNLKGKVVITDIGNIIVSHCGPGTLAVYFMGDERIAD